MKPRKRLPASPMEILAGWKLARKNPAAQPANARPRADTRYRSWSKAMPKMARAAMDDHPGREAVHVVQQVESVGDADDPGHAHWPRPRGPGTPDK